MIELAELLKLKAWQPSFREPSVGKFSQAFTISFRDQSSSQVLFAF